MSAVKRWTCPDCGADGHQVDSGGYACPRCGAEWAYEQEVA